MLNSQKTYYSIREVCEKTSLEPHVLRYWESEFPVLRPKKNRAGNRAYREKDIEIVHTIKHLLYEEQYTIPGAKKKLAASKEKRSQTDQPKNPKHKKIIKDTIKELKDVLKILNKK
jgi:DNA-binding transcriptional MerR regulator